MWALHRVPRLLAVVCRRGCSEACGILPGRIQPASSAVAGGFLAPLVFVIDVTASGVLYTRLGEPKCAFL